MKEIPLTKGKHAIVDSEDYEKLAAHKWYCSPAGYAVREVTIPGGTREKRNRHTVFMHRSIMGEPEGLDVDHINHNKLDNRKANLRPCTHAANTRNVSMHKDNASGFLGVFKDKRSGKYIAKITYKGKQTHVGTFTCAATASKAREAEAKRLKEVFKEITT